MCVSTCRRPQLQPVPQSEPPANSWIDELTVPVGRYAVENKEGELRFYIVKENTHPRFKRYRKVLVQAGDNEHFIKSVQAKPVDPQGDPRSRSGDRHPSVRPRVGCVRRLWPDTDRRGQSRTGHRSCVPRESELVVTRLTITKSDVEASARRLAQAMRATETPEVVVYHGNWSGSHVATRSLVHLA